MSENSPLYVLQPEAPGTEPPGFDSHPAPGFRPADQTAFKTTEDARASYGFCAPPERGYMTPAAEVVALKQQLAALTMRADSATRPTCVAWATEDVQAENRLLTVAELTARALKAEARVKSQQAELGSQEVQMLQLVQESLRLKDAIRAASAPRMTAAEREAYTSNTNGAGTRGAFGAGEIMGRVSLAQGLLNLFDL